MTVTPCSYSDRLMHTPRGDGGERWGHRSVRKLRRLSIKLAVRAPVCPALSTGRVWLTTHTRMIILLACYYCHVGLASTVTMSSFDKSSAGSKLQPSVLTTFKRALCCARWVLWHRQRLMLKSLWICIHSFRCKALRMKVSHRKAYYAYIEYACKIEDT